LLNETFKDEYRARVEWRKCAYRHVRVRPNNLTKFFKNFCVEIEITGTTSNGLDLDKYYSEHDPEQHSRDFSRHLDNANAGGIL